MTGLDLRPVSRGLDTALDRSVVGGFSSIGYAVRRRLPTWPADPLPGALAGRSVLVTGASSGLGAQTTKELLDLGAHVQVVVRDVDKARRGLATLGVTGDVTYWRCDVADLDSVRALTDGLLDAGAPLHGIVHNAGSLPPQRTESAQGHELTMAVHVLGPVLMTERLLPLLDGHRARVQLVTSGGMYGQRLRADDPDYLDGDYSGAAAYARSKRAQVELLGTLQARWPGLDLYAVHPGWAATPGITQSLPTFERLTRPILRTTETGADTTVWLAAVQPPPPGGGLWHDRRERPSTFFGRNAATEAARQQMWQWVAESCGLGH